MIGCIALSKPSVRLCETDIYFVEKPLPTVKESLLEILKNRRDLSVFASLVFNSSVVNEADLDDLSALHTLFVPSDDAFSKNQIRALQCNSTNSEAKYKFGICIGFIEYIFKLKWLIGCMSQTSKSAGPATCTEFQNKTNHGQITYFQSNLQVQFSDWTLAALTCDLGYFLYGNPLVHCLNGEWSDTLGVCESPNDKETACSEITNRGGTVTYFHSSLVANYTVGTTALLMCPLGVLATGNVLSTCINKVWTPELGTCNSPQDITASCSEHPAVDNGLTTYIQASLTTTYAEGTTVYLYCNYGYVLKGAATARCEKDSTTGALEWTQLGSCESINNDNGKTCPDLTVDNGVVTYDLFNPKKLNTYATLMCNIGYILTGNIMATCTEADDGTMKWTNIGRCYSSLPTAASCPEFNISNSLITYDALRPRAHGTAAILGCNFGYYVSGNAVATCDTDDTWSPSLGTCVKL
uniref:Sushi domain-containing protein n=1 Tax=Syphacia muris TaxID=451379 RepID=A0A158R5U0_9BILA